MIKNVSIAFFVKALGAFSLFILTVFISRELPLEEAGYFFLVFSLISILIPVSVFGTNLISLKLISIDFSGKNWNGIITTSITSYIIVLFFSCIVAGLLWSLSPVLAELIWKKPDTIPIIKHSALAIIPMSLSLVTAHHLQGMTKVVKSVMVLSIFMPIFLSAILLIFNIHTAEDTINLLILVSCITLCLGVFFWWKSIPSSKLTFDRPANFSNFLLSCTHVWVISLMVAISQWGSQFIAGSWVKAEEIAYLAVAQRTAMLVSFILIAFNLVAAPRYATLYKQKKFIELKKLALKATYIMTACALPIVIILCVFPGFFMSFFGEEFTKGNDILIILAIGQLINVMTGSVGYLLTMSGHEKDMRNIILISTPSSIILALILIPIYGIVGAAISTAIAVAIQNIGMLFMVKKRLGFSPFLG